MYDYGKGKPTNPVSILQQRVAKVFPDGILYSGVIVDYNEQKRWWRISYEDGDEEQLNFRELCILDTPPDFSSFRYFADGRPLHFTHIIVPLHLLFLLYASLFPYTPVRPRVFHVRGDNCSSLLATDR